MDQQVYTTKTLADRWQCSVDTIETMLRKGEIRAFRVGRRWRIAQAIVLEHERQQAA